MKIDRQLIYKKFNGRCAYCGKEITLKQMQIDHIEPINRGYSKEEFIRYGKQQGSNDFNNLNPSCARCNRWKSNFTIEQFRNEISQQVERLKRDSSAFRMATDYFLVIHGRSKVIFLFEVENEFP